MKELKELVYMINHEPNFEKAKGMLEMLNVVFGTQYGFVARRVVYFDDPNASTCEKYAHAHDLWAYL